MAIETTSEYMARRGLKRGDVIGADAAAPVVVETQAQYLARKDAEAKKPEPKAAAKKADD